MIGGYLLRLLACVRDVGLQGDDSEAIAPPSPRPDLGELLDGVPEVPEVPAEAGGGPGAPATDEEEDDDVLYAPGIVHTLDLTLDDHAYRSLANEPLESVHAWLELDGEGLLRDVGVHLKGTSSYRSIGSKPSWKIDVHEWHPEARLFGIERLTLNNMVQDPTMLHEHLYYWLCEQVGLRGPRHGYAWVRVNEEDVGLYGLVETMDEHFVNRVFSKEDLGTLYEGTGNDFSADRADFEVKEAGGGPVLDDLIATVAATPIDGWLAMLEANFDIEQLLGYWAVDLVAGNPDGYAYNRNNFYLFGSSIDERWTVLPYGADRAFTLADGAVDGSGERPIIALLSSTCFRAEDCRARLQAKIREVADVWIRADLAGHAAEVLPLVEPLCEADPSRDRLCRAAEIQAYVDARMEQIEEELDEL